MIEIQDSGKAPADITLAPGAEETALAAMLAEIVNGNLTSRPGKRKDFQALCSTVYIHAEDADIEITLAFDRGRLTIYNGKAGKPAITIATDSATLLDLTNLQIKLGMPYFFDSTGREVVKKMFNGALKIGGLFTRLPSLIRLTKVLSVA